MPLMDLYKHLAEFSKILNLRIWVLYEIGTYVFLIT